MLGIKYYILTLPSSISMHPRACNTLKHSVSYLKTAPALSY